MMDTTQPAAGTTNIVPIPGMIVTFNAPDDGFRLVATYVPGGVSGAGELLDLAWTDAYGSAFRQTDIDAGNPEIYVHSPESNRA